ESLDNLASAPFDPGEGDFQWDILAVGGAGHPFETSVAPGHAFTDVFAGHLIRAFAVRLKRRRHFTRVPPEQLLWQLPSHDPHRCWIDLDQLVFVLEDNPLARAFEERTEFRFRFPQGALGEFAFGVVDDARSNEVLPFGWQA